MEYVGAIEDYKFNSLTGRVDAHVRLARHPSVVVALPVQSSRADVEVEWLPSDELGSLRGDASSW